MILGDINYKIELFCKLISQVLGLKLVNKI